MSAMFDGGSDDDGDDDDDDGDCDHIIMMAVKKGCITEYY